MAYTKTSWTDGTTPVDASNLNKLEEGVSSVADGLDTLTESVNAMPYFYSGNTNSSSTIRVKLVDRTTHGLALVMVEGNNLVAYSGAVLLIGRGNSSDYINLGGGLTVVGEGDCEWTITAYTNWNNYVIISQCEAEITIE